MKIIKTFPTVTKVIDVEAGIYEVMITTESTDRMGDIVRAAGCKFDNYLKNPVVLLGHSYTDFPVAKTLELTVVPGAGIRAKFQFPESGLYDKADQTRRLWDAGFLNAASIGFMPLKSVNLEPDEPWGSQEYLEWELVEWSIVAVPANQDALRLALDGIEDTLTKRGRVLSAGNEKKLRDAAEAINQVLSQLEETEPEPDKAINTEHGEESNIDPTQNNEISPELQEKIVILLDTLFSHVE